MKEKNNSSDPILGQKSPLEKNANSVWLASTITLFRNIEKFKFPVKLEADRQKQLLAVISKGLLSDSNLTKPKLLQAEEVSPLHKEFLMEHYLSQHGFYQARAGAAFIVDDTGEFLVTLNIHDHVNLHLLDCQGEIENSWNRLVALETSLGKNLSYAFSPKYGFLTSDYTQCGTGLNISVFLQVPGLVHSDKIDAVLERLADDSIYITGIQGNPTEIIGDVIVAQNNYSLGWSEENIIANLCSFTTKMLVEENSIKSKISHEASADIKDKVSRAFGILIHSYQIEAIEALNAISLLKLGVELGWLSGISLQEVNQLFFNCRRAHLLHKCGGEQLKPEEIPHKRAEFIHQSLKNVQQLI